MSGSCKMFLDEHVAGVCLVDRHHQEALQNRRAGGTEWGRIVRGRDRGGDRDFLDGMEIHCGSALELQHIEIRSDDYGEYAVFVNVGSRVRYELGGWDPDGKRTIVLFVTVAGVEFSKPWCSSMRFRWPRRGGKP